MRYENFENKMKKIAKVNLFFYKTRFVWAALILSTATAITSINIIKGDVNGEYNIKDVMTYGESYNPKVSAKMNSAYLEYSLQDKDDYSQNKPYLVGKYKVRGVSKNGFGSTKYGNVFNFEIKQKPIELKVRQSSVYYGDSLSIDSSMINSGDRISNYELTYDDLSSHNPIVSVDSSSLIINNSYGENVTYCYDITYTPKEIEIKNLNVTVSFNSASKVYDGESLSSDYSVQGLLEGDTFRFKKDSPTLSDIGSIENSIGEEFIEVINKDGRDVTSFYNYHISKGNLNISKRDITIKSSSVNRYYNGYALSSNANNDGELNYIIEEGSVLSNHHIDINYVNEGKYASFASENSFNVVIRDNDDNDVSRYYNIQKIYGDLTIEKVPITLTSKSVNQVFDDNSLSVYFNNESDYIESGDLVFGDYLSYNHNIPTIKDPMDERVNDLNFEIKNQNFASFDQNDCYDITYKYGTLKINKIDVSFSTNDIAITYDGEELSASTMDVTHKLTMNIDSGYLLSSHKLVYEFDNEGEYEVTSSYNTLDNWDIVDKDNRSVKDLYYNYQINSIGQISINKRPLTISAKEDVKSSFLWGEPSYDLAKNDLIIDGICSKDEFIYHSTSEKNSEEIGSYYRVMIPGTDYEIKRIDNGKNVLSNYDINTDNLGDFSINKRPLTITSNSINRTYNARKLSALKTSEDYQNLNDKLSSIGSENVLYCSISESTKQYLLPGHEITYHFEHEGEFVSLDNSNKKNQFTYEIYDTINERFVTDKYNVTAIFGELVISKAKLELKTTSLSKVYDGELLLDSDLPEANGLVDNDKLDLTLSYHNGQSQVETPEKTKDNNWVGWRVRNYNYSLEGEDVSGCYDTTLNWGTYSISKRQITVKMPSINIAYDSYTHSPSEGGFYQLDSSSTLASGQYLSFAQIPTYWEANIYSVEELSANYKVTVYDQYGADVSKNYEITYIYSPTIISKISYGFSYVSKALTFEYDYDGTTIDSKYDINSDFENYFSYSGSLASYDFKQLYYIDELSSIPTMDQFKTASIGIKIYNNNPAVLNMKHTYSPVDTTSNYIINPNKVDASYKITASALIIYPGQGEKMYDGYSPNLGVTGMYSYSGIPLTYSVSGVRPYIQLKANQSNSFEAGTYDVKYDLSSLVIKNENGDKVYDAKDPVLSNSFYIIMEGDTGSFTIGKRYIELCFNYYEFLNNSNISSYEYKQGGNYYYVSGSKTYDGSYSNISDYYYFAGNGLSETDSFDLSIDKDLFFRDGSYSSEWLEESNSINIIHSSGLDIKSSYDLHLGSCEYDMKISKRNITIACYDSIKTYDGQPFSNYDDYYYFRRPQISEGYLPVSDRLSTVFADTSYINVGTYIDTFVASITNSSLNEDVTSCYNIKYKYAKITIQPRVIYYRCNSSKMTYNGEPIKMESGSEIVNNTKDTVYIADYYEYVFLSDMGLHAYVIYSGEDNYVAPGTYQVPVSVSLYDEDGNPYTDGNIIMKSYGESQVNVTINKRAVTIKVNKQDYFFCEYDEDGSISSSDGFNGDISFTISGLASKQNVIGVLTFNLINISYSISKNEYDDYIYTYSAYDIEQYLKVLIETSDIFYIADSEGNDVTDYYYFNYDINEITLWS